ncbi:TPM domain-containing protein [Candidatus Woesearchaeota archaeon]|nr:TPM domain-containing protein [Candidatus Woesearchaeota archaeon]
MKKILLIALVFLVLTHHAYAAQIPVINSYVTDNTNSLSSSAKSQLEQDLRDLEKATNGVQYVIFIENEYPKEYSLEEYTLKIAEENRIGKKGNDNGILLYVAIKDRKYRWEVGYGVESTLSSSLLGRVSRETLVPNFQDGNYENGILQAFDVTKRALLNSNDADIVALKDASGIKQDSLSIVFGIVLLLLIIFILFASVNRAKKFSKGIKTKEKHKDDFYKGAAWGLFAGGFGRGGFKGGSGGFGGFSGGGGGFGGGGFSGKF